MIQHGKPETYPPSVTEDSRAGPREQGSSKAFRKPKRKVNNDWAPGDMEPRACALTRCLTLLFPSLGICPGLFSPTVLWEETRTQVNSASSVCLCHACLQRGGGHSAPVPDSHFSLSYSLACPAPIPSPLAQPYASGSQLGVTGSLDF